MQQFIEDNLIILSKQNLDEFLKHDNPGDLIALYTFYYYTAKWQRTNRPRVTDNYVKKGLHWGIDRIQKAKKTLVEIGLISVVNSKKDGKITGWYIQLNYLWKEETIQNTQKPQVEITTCGFQDTNALSSNSLNALNSNNEMLGESYFSIFKDITGKSPEDTGTNRAKYNKLLTSKLKDKPPGYFRDCLTWAWNLKKRQGGDYFHYWRQGNLTKLAKIYHDIIPAYEKHLSGETMQNKVENLLATFKPKIINAPSND